MPEDWMKSDNVNGIDPLKLQMLNSIANQGSQKGMSELLPFLVSSLSNTQKKSETLSFTSKEMDCIIEALKQNKTPEETARIERMLQLIKMMQ